MATTELSGKFIKAKAVKVSETFTKTVIHIQERDDIYEVEVAPKKADEIRPIIQSLKPNQDIKIKAYINSREWQGKYFTSLGLFELMTHVQPKSTPAPVAITADDDLPF